MVETKEQYFWCSSDEDGTHIQSLSATELDHQLKEVASGDWGDVKFLSKIPRADKGCWESDEGSVVIIKGRIVVPAAVETVTRFAIKE